MPSTITLNDGTNDRDFDPLYEQGGTMVYADRSTNALVDGSGELIMGYSRATKQRPTTRITIRFSDPKEITVDGQPTVVATPRFIGEFILPSNGMVAADRLTFLTLVKNLCSHAVTEQYVEELKPVF